MLADKVLSLLRAGKVYHETDIHRAAYHGTSRTISHHSGTIFIKDASFSLSGSGHEQEESRLTANDFKIWVEARSEQEKRVLERWVRGHS